MGFLTDLVLEGYDTAHWNHEYRKFAKKFNAIPISSMDETDEEELKTGDVIGDDGEVIKEEYDGACGRELITSICSFVSAPVRRVIDPTIREQIMEELEKEEAYEEDTKDNLSAGMR